jgi:NADPH:quinone reductase-like Zn-dependent oxidoreductase
MDRQAKAWRRQRGPARSPGIHHNKRRPAGAMSGGQPQDGPGYLGYDPADVVDEVGDGVTAVTVGDEVFGRGQGTRQSTPC